MNHSREQANEPEITKMISLTYMLFGFEDSLSQAMKLGACGSSTLNAKTRSLAPRK